MKDDNREQTAGDCRIMVKGTQVQISYLGRSHTLFNSGGMAYILDLITHAGVPVSFDMLDAAQVQPQACYRQFEHESELTEGGLRLQDKPLSYAMADRKAIYNIKRRLVQIIAELAELEEYNDYARAADLRDEQEALMQYLRDVYRPCGRVRSFPDETAKQRSKVLKALRRVMSDIAAVEPELASLIWESLEINEYLVYRPTGLEIDVYVV